MTCHASANASGTRPRFLFAGTVYQSNGTTPAPSAEVGIQIDRGTYYTAYTATNGNFWVLADSIPDITGAQWQSSIVKLRTTVGEVTMDPGEVPNAGCNSCHTLAIDGVITVP